MVKCKQCKFPHSFHPKNTIMCSFSHSEQRRSWIRTWNLVESRRYQSSSWSLYWNTYQGQNVPLEMALSTRFHPAAITSFGNFVLSQLNNKFSSQIMKICLTGNKQQLEFGCKRRGQSGRYGHTSCRVPRGQGARLQETCRSWRHNGSTTSQRNKKTEAKTSNGTASFKWKW